MIDEKLTYEDYEIVALFGLPWVMIAIGICVMISHSQILFLSLPMLLAVFVMIGMRIMIRAHKDGDILNENHKLRA